MQKIFKNILYLVLFSLFYSNLALGLLPGTKVLMGDGEHKKVEELKVGDFVAVYDLKTKRPYEEPKEIEKIQVKKTKEIVFIKTKAGLVAYGKEQRIYNRRILKFVRAKELKKGDILFSPELRNLEIEDVVVKKLEEKIKLYFPAIKDIYLFLASSDDKYHVLLHNEPITLTLFSIAWGAGAASIEWVSGAAIATAAGALVSQFVQRKAREKGADVGPFNEVHIGTDGSINGQTPPAYFQKKTSNEIEVEVVKNKESEKNKSKNTGGGGPKKEPDDDDNNKPNVGDNCKVTSSTSKARVIKNPSSRTPVGRKGVSSKERNLLEIYKGGDINGRNYTDHAVTRMNERGFTPSVVESAIKNGTRSINKANGRYTYYDSTNHLSVVTEGPEDIVVTVFNEHL